MLTPLTNESDTTEVIKIDRYETKLIKGKAITCAIAGKKSYEMPSCYAEMYDNNHLAIAPKTMEMPEVYDAPKTHYVPLFTGDKL